MLKKSALIPFALLALGVVGFIVFIRGNEDTWLCQGGVWVRHGNPSAPQPVQPCTAQGVAADTADYHDRGLTTFPRAVLQRPTTTILDLSGNFLTSLPSAVGRLTRLKHLDVSSNQLTGALPAEIRLMPELRLLNASRNQLTGIPAEVGQLKHLVTLDLSHNQITAVPNELFNLRGTLQELYLKDNRFTAAQIAELRLKLYGTHVSADY